MGFCPSKLSLPYYYPITALPALPTLPTLLLPYYCPTYPTTTLLLPYPTTAILFYSNTPGYIILVVAASPSCGSNSESLSISVTLNSAIYSCLCVKTGIRKSTLIKLKDCPCDLFTVIVKHSRIRNCLLLIINGSSPSVEVSLI